MDEKINPKIVRKVGKFGISNRNIAIDEEKVQNCVMNEELVQNSVMDERIVKTLVMNAKNVRRLWWICPNSKLVMEQFATQQPTICWNNILMKMNLGC